MNWQSFFQNYSHLIKKFLPGLRPTSTIGFDVGTSSVKAVEINFQEDSFDLRHWAIEPVEGSDTKTALKRLFDRMNIKSQIPVASVSGKGTLIRYIDMPRMSIDELKKAIVYEIDKYFPFDPQTIYTDCCILDPDNQDKKMSVLVVATKKELVDERIKLFKEVGMELTSVTISSIATANAFERLVKGQAPTGARAILDIGGSTSNLMILGKNHSPRFTRDIFIGSQDITKQISKSLGIDVIQAEQLKCSPGERLNEITQACEALIDNLTGETHLSFDYFMTEKNLPVGDLFLVGGGASFKGIQEAFEKKLNMPVKIWNPLTGLHLGPQVVAEEINPFSTQLGVAIGLALTKI